MRRAPPIHEFQQVHTEGKLLGVPQADLGPGKYKNIQQILIGGIIVGAVAFLMIGGYARARRPAYMADCQGRLRILAQAFEMYATDHNGFYPVADSWRYAISEYIDLVGVQTSDGETVRRTAKPRGFSSPMRCLGNHSVVPISYFYLSPDDFQAAGGEDAPGTPMLVDEVNHPKVMVLSCDSSCRRVDPMTWIAERDGPLQIARRPDWRKTFAYMSTRPVVPQQLRPPDVSVYVAPWQAASPPPPESR